MSYTSKRAISFYNYYVIFNHFDLVGLSLLFIQLMGGTLVKVLGVRVLLYLLPARINFWL